METLVCVRIGGLKKLEPEDRKQGLQEYSCVLPLPLRPGLPGGTAQSRQALPCQLLSHRRAFSRTALTDTSRACFTDPHSSFSPCYDKIANRKNSWEEGFILLCCFVGFSSLSLFH